MGFSLIELKMDLSWFELYDEFSLIASDLFVWKLNSRYIFIREYLWVNIL